ncbi:hypothetical protein M8J77_011919 [Diaphorina citri]|nr:hypothetical protein M8J77_011919 [Diaphorina citri]
MSSSIVHPDQCDSNESSIQNEGTNQIAGNPYIVAIEYESFAVLTRLSAPQTKSTEPEKLLPRQESNPESPACNAKDPGCASDIVAPGHRIPETEDQTQPDLPTRGPEEPWSCRDLFAPATLPLFYGGRGGEV